jgi:dihydroneopterin aldolase
LDKIYIQDLTIDTTIGVHAAERNIKQRVVVSLEFGTDIAPAAKADNVDYTIDYETVARRVTSLVEARADHLIETLAELIADLLLDEFDTSWVRVDVRKPGAIANAATVGVSIKRRINT